MLPLPLMCRERGLVPSLGLMLAVICGSSAEGNLNDLWEFSPTAKTCTWMGGSNTANHTGVYGTLGTPAATNVPGARGAAVSWTDGSGKFWLFGGGGYDSAGTQGDLNDLWEFNPRTKEWTWVSGSNTVNAVGVYGTQGVASASNVPGAAIILSVGLTEAAISGSSVVCLASRSSLMSMISGNLLLRIRSGRG